MTILVIFKVVFVLQQHHGNLTALCSLEHRIQDKVPVTYATGRTHLLDNLIVGISLGSSNLRRLIIQKYFTKQVLLDNSKNLPGYGQALRTYNLIYCLLYVCTIEICVSLTPIVLNQF